MAEAVLDLETLLAPVDGGAGVDLRLDESANSLYRRLKDARGDARREERAKESSDEKEPPVPQGWREVKTLGVQCLAGHSKDFEVASLLLEALVRLDGLAGLIDGTELLAGLLERYWDPGFPQPNEYGLEDRTTPLGALSGESADGTLMQPLRRLPLFRRADGSGVGLHLWKIAEDTDAIPDEGDSAKRRKARFAAGVPEMPALMAEARVDAEALRRNARLAARAEAAWAALGAAMDTRLGPLSPNTRRVAEALETMGQVATRLIGPIAAAAAEPETREVGAVTDQAGVDQAATDQAGAGAVAGTMMAPRALRTRDDAIRQLEEIADFFRRTEPHSPLAYTLDDAARRARLPLPELLAEVLPDSGARQAMLTMLGIRIPEGEPG